MGLETNEGKLTYLNIKEGKLSYKNEKGEKAIADGISGVITKVEYADEEYQGKKYNKAKITIMDGENKFLLQMNTDSGYFRGMCNSLRSGDPVKRLKISPFYKVTDGKKQSTCFVEQNGKTLKHFFTKENPGDLPQVEKVIFKGKDEYDGTKQIEYWKNWLASQAYESEFLQGSVSPTPQDNKQSSENVFAKKNKETSDPFGASSDDDDLPF